MSDGLEGWWKVEEAGERSAGRASGKTRQRGRMVLKGKKGKKREEVEEEKEDAEGLTEGEREGGGEERFSSSNVSVEKKLAVFEGSVWRGGHERWRRGRSSRSPARP